MVSLISFSLLPHTPLPTTLPLPTHHTNITHTHTIHHAHTTYTHPTPTPTVTVLPGLRLQPHYAGHVLGAAMFSAWSGEHSVLYTGDFNTSSDRHLGPARLSRRRLRPDVVISEATYGSAPVRKGGRGQRERAFLRKVHACVKAGGKVLIPVFALGRAQELCLLLESYWERMGLDVPLCFASDLAEKANRLFRLYVSWMHEGIRARAMGQAGPTAGGGGASGGGGGRSSSSSSSENVFDFKHVKVRHA